MESIILYGISGELLLLSFWKSKEKTMLAIRKAWKSFERILPQFFVVLLLVGFLLAVLDAELISQIIGSKSGWPGVILAAATGSIALIPGFIAFVM